MSASNSSHVHSCWITLHSVMFHRLGVPEQALGGIPLGFGIVVKDKLSCLINNLHSMTVFTAVGLKLNSESTECRSCRHTAKLYD